jgi:hypothetical protein
MGISLKGKMFAVLVVVLLGPVLVFSQVPSGEKMPWWYTMERGKLLFRTGEYGDALLAFEDARRERRELFTRMERDFVLFLSIPEVRRLGDSLERLETYAAERGQAAAAEALGELYYRYPREKLDNSAARALYELGRLKNYPDAEYWIGETYRAEGELALAMMQYRKALADRELFETPGFDLPVSYKIAEIQKLRREYTEMEKPTGKYSPGRGTPCGPKNRLLPKPPWKIPCKTRESTVFLPCTAIITAPSNRPTVPWAFFSMPREGTAPGRPRIT